MKYPIILEKDKQRKECGRRSKSIEKFLEETSEKVSLENFTEFMRSVKFTSKETELATFQEVIKELGRVLISITVMSDCVANYKMWYDVLDHQYRLGHYQTVCKYLMSKFKGEADSIIEGSTRYALGISQMIVESTYMVLKLKGV